jgi:hypothetical protein
MGRLWGSLTHQRSGLENPYQRLTSAHGILRRFFLHAMLWRLCAGDLRVCRVLLGVTGFSSPRTAATFRLENESGSSIMPAWSNALMFKPTPNPPHTPSHLFQVAPNATTETLLVYACESLASASVMASDLAGFLEGTHRNTMQGIQQVIMLGELVVNRALDNIDPQD